MHTLSKSEFVTEGARTGIHDFQHGLGLGTGMQWAGGGLGQVFTGCEAPAGDGTLFRVEERHDEIRIGLGGEPVIDECRGDQQRVREHGMALYVTCCDFQGRKVAPGWQLTPGDGTEQFDSGAQGGLGGEPFPVVVGVLTCKQDHQGEIDNGPAHGGAGACWSGGGRRVDRRAVMAWRIAGLSGRTVEVRGAGVENRLAGAATDLAPRGGELFGLHAKHRAALRTAGLRGLPGVQRRRPSSRTQSSSTVVGAMSNQGS